MSEVTVPDGEAPAAETPQGRGRPRPSSTVERDKVVLEFIAANGPQTRAQVAAGTQLPGNEVYLSLYRLNRAEPKQVEKRGLTWVVAGYVPPETPAA